MKVLIGAGNYPKLSESYIEAEIKYLLRSGLDVAVYSPIVGSPEAPELVKVYRDAEKAFREHQPDIFHVHYITFDMNVINMAGKKGVPVTIRGHSFDFSVEGVKRLAGCHAVKRIWLFPHFSALVANRKVLQLPVAYDSTIYKPAEKDRRLVYRTGAGKHGKGLEEFFEIAKACPDFKFSLSANVVMGEEAYMGVLSALVAGTQVEYRRDIGREEAAQRMSRAGIYLDTSDSRAHPFGMPISIAEAMATGSYVIARSSPAAVAYIEDAGAFYGSPQEAADLVKATAYWPDSEWSRRRDISIRRAQKFADHAVLAEEISFWKSLA